MASPGLDEAVWVRLDTARPDEWCAASLTSRRGDAVEVITDGGARAIVPQDRAVPRNSEDQDDVRDLSQLVHLSEPCLMHALACRYASGHIYTNTGSILIALNPWKPCEQLYSAEQVEAYRGTAMGSMPPHLFAVADTAYRGLLQDGDDQTILVSGESGAGKTESTRRLLEFLVAASSSGRATRAEDRRGRGAESATPGGITAPASAKLARHSGHLGAKPLLRGVPPPPGARQAAGALQRKLLKANPLLETFGNAQTLCARPPPRWLVPHPLPSNVPALDCAFHRMLRCSLRRSRLPAPLTLVCPCPSGRARALPTQSQRQLEPVWQVRPALPGLDR